MADLLAIISPARREPVDEAAMDDFVRAYAGLRGAPAHRADADCGWARVAVLDHLTVPSAGVERDGEAWTAWAGPLAPGDVGGPLAALGGQFALVRSERVGDLVAATDALGLKPFFTAVKGGRTYLSTSALALARLLRLPPSRAGIAAFLRIGNQFGRITPWDGVRRLMPAEALRFSDDGTVASSLYWQPTVEPGIRRLDFDDCATACVERGSEAMAASYAGTDPWVDLTGGFDTRLLALFAAGADVRFTANTIGDAENEDSILAARMAARAGWPWERFGMPADWGEQLPERIEAAVAWGDCHLDALLIAEVMEGHRAKRAGGERLLNGGGGEHFRDYPWGHELLRAGRSRQVAFDRLIAWRVLGPLDLGIFRRDPTASVVADVRAELELRVAPFAGTPNTFQDDLLYAFKATGHFGAFQAASGGNMRVELPFYDRDIFGTAISASPRHRAYHRLMREMIHRLDPAIAALPTETGGPAEPVRLANLPRFAPYAWRRGARFAGRLRGRLWGSGDPAAPSPGTLARGALVGALREQGRLAPAHMRSAALWDPQRLEATLERAVQAPGTVDWGILGRLVTVELALAALDTGIE
jgi:asparagine synthetase B (glutamine-hydrolysing)